MTFGLSDATIEKIRSVFARHPQVEKVVLYGSRAKGTFRNGSDIDLTLFGDDLTYEMLCRISRELDDLLLPHSFDLSLFAHIRDADVVDHIRRVGVAFYEKTDPFGGAKSDGGRR
jgi:predicted nucleotidyltransferase